MKNWKTTLASLFAGGTGLVDAILKAYEAGAFDGKTGMQLLASIGLIALGWFAQDKNASGTGTVKQ